MPDFRSEVKAAVHEAIMEWRLKDSRGVMSGNGVEWGKAEELADSLTSPIVRAIWPLLKRSAPTNSASNDRGVLPQGAEQDG